MTGVSLFKLLDYSINTATFEPEVSDDGGQLLQVSGMKIAFNPKLEEHRIISIDVFDKENETFVPVERLRLYSFATDSYVCGGYDFYAEILGNSLVFEGEDQGFIGSVLHQDVVAAYLDQSGTYDTSLQSRLSNKTISNVPLNMIENPENCRPGSFYSDTRYSCEICPPNIKVHFLSEQIVMSGESGSVSIPIESIDLVNSELYNVSVALKSYPSWIKIAGNGNGIAYDVGKLIEIKSGEQITVEIWATPELLEPGTALATVAFSVVNGGSFLGCSWSDATFDILLRVTPTANLNQLGMVRVLGYSLSGIAVFTALFFCMWVIKRRKLRIVKTMQPVFLVAVCVGVSIMALSIVPMSIDDQTASDRGSDMACMAIPWLFSMGFTLSQSALFSKLWRINKLFNARQVRRMQVTEKDVIGPFALLFTLNFSFLLVLTLVDPVRFERVPVGVEEWNTYGKCSTGGAVGTTMFFLIVAVNLCAVAIACYQAYLARNVSDEFSESKRLGTVMFSWAQMMLVGLPVIFLIDADNPIARYFLVVTLTFARKCSVNTITYQIEVSNQNSPFTVRDMTVCESMLLLIFIPILLHVRRSRGTSIAGSTAIRDAIHKSTNPSAQHTAIGHTRITGISIESSGGRINEIDSHFDPPGLEDNTAGGAAVFHDHTLARDLCENDAGKRNGLGPSQAPIEHRSELKEPSVVTPGMAIDEASDRMETAT